MTEYGCAAKAPGAIACPSRIISTHPLLQSETEALAESVRVGRILAVHRGRRCTLRDLRERQKRLDKLAGLFGFRREWRKHLRIPAASRRHSEGPAG